jgi:GT2 family glycosyltransferase
MISIVIPAYNQLEYTRQCIESIRLHTRIPYRLILVDNGSTEPVAEYFHSISGATVIRSDINTGFAAGVNLGIARAEGHVLLLNNDTLVPPGALESLHGALLQSPDIGMAGPTSNYVSGSQLIPGLNFSDTGEINAYAAARRAEFSGVIRDVARLVGFCLLIRDSVVAEVGPLDEVYGIGNFEDDDYCVRVLRAGYRLVVDEGSFVFHYGNRTFQSLGLVDAAWDRLIEENAARFGAKFDLRPEDRVDEYQQAMQLNRAAGEALAAGDLAAALRNYRDALRLAPRLARNHNDLAVALWQAGARQQALERVQAALQIDPNYTEARENRRDMRQALGLETDRSPAAQDQHETPGESHHP